MNQFELSGEPRTSFGKGHARRMRRAGRVPAVVYGGGEIPDSLSLSSRELEKQVANEAFYSHILTLKRATGEVQVVVKDLQRDPVTGRVTHVDFQRVRVDEEISVHVPLHFSNEERCVGRKAGGILSRHMLELAVSCLPRYLPEFIEVDVAALDIGDAVTLGEVVLPEGVALTAHDADLSVPVVSVQHAQKLEVEPEEGEEGASAPEGVAAATEGGSSAAE